MELARRILDELMGPERNKMPNEKGSFGVRFTDPEVLKIIVVMISLMSFSGLQIRFSRFLSISRIHEYKIRYWTVSLSLS